MHSPVEVADPGDIDNAGKLVAALVKDIARGGNANA
jgi:putative aminopeptidase FrvX